MSSPKPLGLYPWQVEAAKPGVVLDVRRVVTAGNAKPVRGKFEQVDRDTLLGIRSGAGAYLRGRADYPGGQRRTVTILGNVSPGDLLYITGKNRTRAQPPALWVSAVSVERLHSFSNATSTQARVVPTVDTPNSRYASIVEHMKPHARSRWLRTEHHYNARHWGATPWHVFAAQWIADEGFKSWSDNPWVWVYTCRVLNLDVDAAASLARGGALSQIWASLVAARAVAVAARMQDKGAP